MCYDTLSDLTIMCRVYMYTCMFVIYYNPKGYKGKKGGKDQESIPGFKISQCIPLCTVPIVTIIVTSTTGMSPRLTPRKTGVRLSLCTKKVTQNLIHLSLIYQKQLQTQ